jgi:hypothetical protein
MDTNDALSRMPMRGPSEAAHTGNDGGMSMKASDYSCVPLCYNCHTQAPSAYHRIGKRAFERVHDVCFAAEVRRLNAIWKAWNSRYLPHCSSLRIISLGVFSSAISFANSVYPFRKDQPKQPVFYQPGQETASAFKAGVHSRLQSLDVHLPERSWRYRQ